MSAEIEALDNDGLPLESQKRKPAEINLDEQDALRDKVQVTLGKNELKYNTHDCYSKRGLFQFLARHPRFENTTLVVIALNALFMWIDTDFNSGTEFLLYNPGFQVTEHLFCIFFSVELYIRFRAFQRKLSCLCDGWFVFDSLLVLLMVMETWFFNLLVVLTGDPGLNPLGGNAGTVRLFRLLRLSRLVRMLRSMPELMILVKGMLTAMKSVASVGFMLIVMLYVFGIALTQASKGYEFHDVWFTSVWYSVYSLLIYATFLDNLASFLGEFLLAEAWLCLTLAFVFIFLACLTILNMLIGVLCEVVAEVADYEKATIQEDIMTEHMSSIIADIDEDFNGRISYSEFEQIIKIPSALKALEDINVDPVLLVDFADMFFMKDGELQDLSFDEFVKIVFDLRGNNDATVKDVINVWKQVNPKMIAPNKDLQTMTLTMKKINMELTLSTRRIEGKIGEVLNMLTSIGMSPGRSSNSSQRASAGRHR